MYASNLHFLQTYNFQLFLIVIDFLHTSVDLLQTGVGIMCLVHLGLPLTQFISSFLYPNQTLSTLYVTDMATMRLLFLHIIDPNIRQPKP